MTHKETKKTPSGSSLFDLRYILAVLFVIYGVVTLVMGLTSFTPADSAKTGGININLWGGIVMVVLALLFVLWARLRPVVIEATMAPEDMAPENVTPGQ